MKKSFPLTGISSVVLHTGKEHHADFAHNTPIYASSTFTFPSAEEGMERFAGKDKTRIYSRWGNPTFTVAEEIIAALESFGITYDDDSPLELKALLHASGQGALSTLFLSRLQAGDTILSHLSLYGGTQELMQKVLKDSGINTKLVDMRDLNQVREALNQDKTIRLVHLETPANPTIRCVDIEAICSIAHEKNISVSVDNTFATPYLQQPFLHGADFVVHSTTKFLNGHGNAMGGVLLGKDIEFMTTKAWKWYALLGANSNPFDAFLLIQGLRTLELRMERHCHNAMEVAHFLVQHPAIEHVNYNGLPDHPDFAVSNQQMKHPGALLSFELKGGLEAGKQFINRLQLCTRAVSLGTPDTLLSHPASMSHFGIPPAERKAYGITDGLIRMSVGIENIQDILADLDQALS
ncbi:MAG: aminotransferase class I/II-fold pyridoxal phosphate-dependent enzyme [Sediminibacterium sp.]|jgi:methionine-gamma-lyase|nr:aminotransferase class I/II-fold pyridoxal phosphate-dependent enzyme [Sediminibacterium sp.]